jgi:acetylornithine deacetylase/succinyl-diaminopimelate desuccinylase-like protein
LLAHIDVVEALPGDWSPDLNPFDFLEREGSAA